MVSSYFNPLTGMTVTSTTSFSTSTVYTDSDSRVDTDTDTDSLDSDNDGGSITSSFSSMTSAGGVSALTFGTSYSAWSMSDSESPTAGSSDDDTWGNTTVTFQETGGSPTVSSNSYNVTYNNTLSAGIVTVPAAASVWIQKVQEFEGAVGTAGSSGSGSSSSSSNSSGATSSASAGTSGSSGSSSSSSSSSSGSGSSSSSSSSSAPGATGNAPAAAAAGPSARAVQAPPLPNSGGMMVAAGAMTMPAMNGMAVGGGLGNAAEPPAADPSDDDGGWFWRFMGFMQEPSGPPPAESERIASAEEMLRQNEAISKPGLNWEYLRHRGETTKNAWGEVDNTITNEFVVYAAAMAVEIAWDTLGIEERGALIVLEKAGQIVLKPVWKAGKWFYQVWKKDKTGKVEKITKDGLKQLIKQTIENTPDEALPPIRTKEYGGPGGGHHVPAKKNFEGATGFKPKKALAIPNSELGRLGVDHLGVLTPAQRRLYIEFNKAGGKLTWEAIEEIETRALVIAGVEERSARAVVRRCIQSLIDAGFNPTQIPWGG
jgi:hypothetical protein